MTRWSPRTTTSFMASSSTITGKALSVAPAGTWSEPTSASMVVAPGVCTSSGALRPGGSSHRLGVGGGDLDVGGVARRERDVVLARRARRHVFVGAVTAHHPDVGGDAVPLQAGAVEHPGVGLGVLVVGDVEPLAVTVEGVGVLHDELAGAQHPGPGPRLIALLDLEVVEDERQVAVGLDRGRHVPGDDLLVGHRQDHVGAPAVLELEQLVDVVAAGAPPRLGRVHHRHEQLLAADGVHLLAHDLHDALMDPPSGGQPRPQSGPHLADEPGAHHELVRDRLGVGRRVAFGRQEVGGKEGHRGPSVPARRVLQRGAMF